MVVTKLSVASVTDAWKGTERWWCNTDWENRNTRRQACAIASLCSTNPTRIDLGFDPVLAMRGRRPISRSMGEGGGAELWVELYVVYTVFSVTECGTIWLETGIWKLRRFKRGFEEQRYLLYVGEKDSEHALLKCREAKQWRGKLVSDNVIETVAWKEVLNCAKVIEIKSVKKIFLKLGEPTVGTWSRQDAAVTADYRKKHDKVRRWLRRKWKLPITYWKYHVV